MSNWVYFDNLPGSSDFSNMVIAIPIPILSVERQALKSDRGINPPRCSHLLIVSLTRDKFPLIVELSRLQKISKLTLLISFNNFVSSDL